MQNSNHYPKAKVILAYALFGGIAGGLIFVLCILVLAIGEQILYQNFRLDWTSVKYGILAGVIYIVVATIFGTPAALLTGIVIANKKVKVEKIQDYATIFVTGAALSAILGGIIGFFFTFMMATTVQTKLLTNTLIWITMFASIGGLSAIILAKLVVPKGKAKMPTKP